MSWYPKDIVQCPQCKRVLATPIDCAEHRKGCTWRRTDYPNGSIEMREQRTGAGYMKAPNPFGSMWQMTFENRIFGAGGNPDAQGIWRRGKKWYPHFESGKGWWWA